MAPSGIIQFLDCPADKQEANPVAPLACLMEVAPVMDSITRLPTFDSLRSHVHQVLCQHDQLEPSQTPIYQAIITRSGRPCGLFFQVQGPRLVKTYAIWAGEENRILFYDSMGGRFAETRLTEAPDPLQLGSSAGSTQHSRRKAA